MDGAELATRSCVVTKHANLCIVRLITVREEEGLQQQEAPASTEMVPLESSSSPLLVLWESGAAAEACCNTL